MPTLDWFNNRRHLAEGGRNVAERLYPSPNKSTEEVNASGRVGNYPVLKQKNGADDRIRTGDLLITNQLLYQLSYVGLGRREGPAR